MDFVERGRLRAGLLETYRTIECDARRDETEGEGLYILKQDVEQGQSLDGQDVVPQRPPGLSPICHTSSTNLIFALCFLNISVDLEKMKARFGQHVVKVFSPVSLAIEIDYSLNGEDGKSGPFQVYGKNIEYNKGELIEDGRTPELLTDLAFTQKPKRFSDEKEYRMCITGTGGQSVPEDNTGVYLSILLDSGRSSYAKML